MTTAVSPILPDFAEDKTRTGAPRTSGEPNRERAEDKGGVGCTEGEGVSDGETGGEEVAEEAAEGDGRRA